MGQIIGTKSTGKLPKALRVSAIAWAAKKENTSYPQYPVFSEKRVANRTVCDPETIISGCADIPPVQAGHRRMQPFPDGNRAPRRYRCCKRSRSG